jgi:hypothetical protein
MVLSVLCCGYGHLLLDGFGGPGLGHHHCGTSEGGFSVNNGEDGHPTGSHWHSHDPDTPCDEWLCHCHLSLCNALGVKTMLIAIDSPHESFFSAANDAFAGETVMPLRLPPRTC